MFKFVKAALLLAVGLGAVGLVHGGVTVVSQRILAVVNSGVERRVTMSVLSRVTRISPQRLELVGAGAFAYAALFTVEGIGLWLQTRWAEYLTVIATISFIPFEVVELTHRITAPRIIALALNLVVVVYLIVRLWRHRRGSGPPS